MASPSEISRSQDAGGSTGSSTGFTGFLTDPAEFDKDPRISWSRLDNCWILEREDGEEFRFDTGLKRWILEVDPELIRQQQSAYIPEGVDADDYEELHPRERRARARALQQAHAKKQKKGRVNTAVWVTHIPLDADRDEIYRVFSKCGVIAEEIDSGDHKIKMYKDEDGNFNGEALVVFFRPESINLAISLLDETEFRFGETTPGGPMRVKESDPSYLLKRKDGAEKRKVNTNDQKKIIERTQRLNSKLADWSDDDARPLKRKATRAEHVLILEHMFTLKLIEEDPAEIIELKEEVREECEKFGEVTRVVLYDEEPTGIITVRFKDARDAARCRERMDGRHFGGATVRAYINESRTLFRKSDNRYYGYDSEREEEEQRRLDRYGDWLERNEPKAKKAKTEEAKTEEAKTEEVKTEEVKTEEVKADEPKADAPQTHE
ncbi:unnamed protein product [Penicillium olsonii]|uniref:RRM domain-containing protein n=1 Tax=Penicillium olsonii TaxID=99116 RepID=A0A9W4IB06_PENOL|nr:unnamed protein product [Penicillium olsonii]CAG8251820.1 unnamed protein product [Penicillium olsonii]